MEKIKDEPFVPLGKLHIFTVIWDFFVFVATVRDFGL